MPGEQKAAATFENGLEQLELIVKEMESADLPLERALELFEKGMQLSGTCRKQLEDAERIEKMREATLTPALPAGGVAGRFALLAACALFFVAAELGFNRALPAVARTSALAAVALTGGEAWPVSELARVRAAGPRAADAAPLYRAAFALDGRPGHLANAAFAENRAGRCEAARALAGEAASALAGLPGRPDPWDAHLVSRAQDVAKGCGRGAHAPSDADP